MHFEGLTEALIAQQERLLARSDKPMHFGPFEVDRQKYATALSRLKDLLASDSTESDIVTYVRDSFRFVEACRDETCDGILLTGYFEPVIKGSREANESHSRPLYRAPSDLVGADKVERARFCSPDGPSRGRLVDGRLVPYYSRAEIDGDGILANKGLELCYVDPVDAFFLQIQGSGTIVLDDGTELFLNFADKNGLKYHPIGQDLRERIAPRTITMQSIKDVLRSLPAEERDQILFRNPSYVFFRPGTQRAVTALGVPATAGRTVAVDPSIIPLGSLALLTVPPESANGGKDTPSAVRSRLVVSQDTGSAIKGAGRVDLFCGRGDEAGALAGRLQAKARIYYLVPK
jgi:membrane-bound lytic murein transglycosylase A